MASSKKILFVTRRLGGDNGEDIAAVDIARALADNGNQVAVLALAGDAVSSGMDLVVARMPYDGIDLAGPVWRQTVLYAKGAWRYRGCMKRLRQYSPDLVVVQDVGGHRLAAQMGLDDYRPAVVILQSLPSYYGGDVHQGELCRVITELKKYDGYVSLSRYALDAWQGAGVVGEKPTFCIPNCGRDEAFHSLVARNKSEVRSELGYSEKEILAVVPASIQYRKGQDILIEILPELFKRMPRLKLIVVGALMGGYGSWLQQRATKLQVGDQVEFVGQRSDVLKYIYAADVMLFSPRSETQGIVVLEAMALKTPVIASAIGGIPEMITDGVSGCLFDESRPECIFSILARLLNDPDRMRLLAEHASHRYWAEFSRPVHARLYGDMVSSMVRD